MHYKMYASMYTYTWCCLVMCIIWEQIWYLSSIVGLSDSRFEGVWWITPMAFLYFGIGLVGRVCTSEMLTDFWIEWSRYKPVNRCVPLTHMHTQVCICTAHTVWDSGARNIGVPGGRSPALAPPRPKQHLALILTHAHMYAAHIVWDRGARNPGTPGD